MDKNILYTIPAFNIIAIKYPHVAIKIKQLWGTPELARYMTYLFTDTRDGERKGFPEEHLILLQEIKEISGF